MRENCALGQVAWKDVFVTACDVLFHFYDVQFVVVYVNNPVQ